MPNKLLGLCLACLMLLRRISGRSNHYCVFMFLRRFRLEAALSAQAESEEGEKRRIRKKQITELLSGVDDAFVM